MRDDKVPTRLQEDETVVFRLGQIEDGKIAPYYPVQDGDTRRPWALSEVAIVKRHADGLPRRPAP